MRFNILTLAGVAFGVCMIMPGAGAHAADSAADTAVTIVCEHGSAKSLIAASLFNQVAESRGLPFRAVSRAINPDDGVPPKIVEAMRGDGFDVANYRPRKLTDQDLAASLQLVAIGVDSSSWQNKATSIQQWNDVPSANANYAASRASLLRYVNALLDKLEESR